MRRELVAVVLAGSLCLGCASVQAVSNTVSGWFGGPDATAGAAVRPHAYYAAKVQVPLRRAPDPDSAQIGELALHEGVLRTRVEGGFVYVTSDKDGEAGWVKQSELIERLPGAKKPAAAAPGSAPEPSATPEQPAVTGEPTDTDEPPEPEEPPEQPPEKSIFDPY